MVSGSGGENQIVPCSTPGFPIMSTRISHSPLDPIIGPMIAATYPRLGIPRWFPPEAIVLFGHGCAIAGAVGFAFSTGTAWGGLLAAAGVAGNHFADCVDGTHARSTGQCRHGGELLDHFTDPLSFAYVLIGIAVGVGQPWWGVAAVTCLFAHAVLVNIRAKMTDRFELGAFGPTECKVLLVAVGIAASVGSMAAEPTILVSIGGWALALAVVAGAVSLIRELVRSVRQVNAAQRPVDQADWVRTRGNL